MYVAAGVIGGVNTMVSYKVKYKDANGKTITSVESHGLNISPLSLDYTAQDRLWFWFVC